MTTELPKILFHACPRCNGDLFNDSEEEAYVCLQCGRATPANGLQQTGVIVGTPAGNREGSKGDLVAA